MPSARKIKKNKKINRFFPPRPRPCEVGVRGRPRSFKPCRAMPPLLPPYSVNTSVDRLPLATPTPSSPLDVSQNKTAQLEPLQVICAWPVSGQYGPGSRILYARDSVPTSELEEAWTDPDSVRYYVLIAACLVARKKEWLRNATLAAALIFPAVAAVHGIVLAALHVEGE